MTVSTRTRFEILKRDGFKCRYCGANASSVMLHVDHVLAIVNGGTDDPENLITACATCNLGKSDVPLHQSDLEPSASPDRMREHAEQIRHYLDAVRELEDAKGSLEQEVIDRWVAKVDPKGMCVQLINSLSYWIEAVGLESVFHAVDAVSRRPIYNPVAQRRYFLACVRNIRDARRCQ